MQVWARQRTSIYSHDCLNGYLISAILVFLTMDSGGSIINRSMTTRQIFRVAINFFGTSKQQKVDISFMFNRLLYLSLFACSNFEDVVEGLGDSANEEAYYQQRGLSTCCI